MKTQDLTGAALNWAVAKAEGLLDQLGARAPVGFRPASSWTDAGPIVDREDISLNVSHTKRKDGGEARYVVASMTPVFRFQNYRSRMARVEATGDSATVAAMRCYVAAKLGPAVDLPEALSR